MACSALAALTLMTAASVEAQLPVEVLSFDQPPAVLQPLAVAPAAYSRVAWLARVQGEVLVDLRLLADGSVAEARVAKGLPSLDESARLAALAWRFAPQPVERWVRARIEFVPSAEPTASERATPGGARRWLSRLAAMGPLPWGAENCRAFDELERSSRTFPEAVADRRSLFSEFEKSPLGPVAFIAATRMAELDGAPADEVHQLMLASAFVCAHCSVPREMERQDATQVRPAAAREQRALAKALSEAGLAGSPMNASIGNGWARSTVGNGSDRTWGEAYYLYDGDKWRVACPPTVTFLS